MEQTAVTSATVGIAKVVSLAGKLLTIRLLLGGVLVFRAPPARPLLSSRA